MSRLLSVLWPGPVLFQCSSSSQLLKIENCFSSIQVLARVLHRKRPSRRYRYRRRLTMRHGVTWEVPWSAICEPEPRKASGLVQSPEWWRADGVDFSPSLKAWESGVLRAREDWCPGQQLGIQQIQPSSTFLSYSALNWLDEARSHCRGPSALRHPPTPMWLCSWKTLIDRLEIMYNCTSGHPVAQSSGHKINPQRPCCLGLPRGETGACFPPTHFLPSDKNGVLFLSSTTSLFLSKPQISNTGDQRTFATSSYCFLEIRSAIFKWYMWHVSYLNVDTPSLILSQNIESPQYIQVNWT